MGITVRSRGRSGEILVEDERTDGTLVYLICRPWDDALGTGVLVGPGEVPEADKDLQGRFPLLTVDSQHEPFRITIETTDLPAEPLQFRSEAFLDMAAKAADAGVDRI